MAFCWNTEASIGATCDERQVEKLSLPLFLKLLFTYLTATNLDQSRVQRESKSNSQQSRKRRCEKSYKLTNHSDIKWVLTKAAKQWLPAVSKSLFHFRTTEEMETLGCVIKERFVIKYNNIILRASCTIKVANTLEGR